MNAVKTSIGFAALCLISLQILAGISAGDDLTQISAAVDTAFFSRDTDALRRLISELSSREVENSLYLLAYAHFRLAELTKNDKESAKTHFNFCIEKLKKLVELEPENAEAYALLGNCYGRSTKYYMLRAATRGMQSDKAMRHARELEPDNPRVLLLQAIGLYFRPAIFGGDKQKAMKLYREATERFADWRGGPANIPDWGAAEAWAYLGYARQEAGQPEQARQAYRRALALRPDYVAVTEALKTLEQAPTAD